MEYIKGKNGSSRIEGLGVNLLDESSDIPTNQKFDADWMSQLLD